MKIRVVKKRTFYGDESGIDSFHSACYHGFLLDGRYYRNIHSIYSLAMPSLDLVGTDSTKMILGTVPGGVVRSLSGVSWFNQIFNVGDFSHWDIEGFHDDGVSVREYLAAKSEHSSLSCWSLSINDLSSHECADGAEVRIDIDPDVDNAEIRFRVPRELLTPDLAFRYDDALYFSEKVYGRLASVLFKPFFVIREVDVF